jgi:hypothetical protein
MQPLIHVEITTADEAGPVPKDGFIGPRIGQFDVDPRERMGLNDDRRPKFHTQDLSSRLGLAEVP